MTAIARQILEQILRLPDDERQAITSELLRQDEREWDELVRVARDTAAERGLDDDTIARIIESRRYGPSEDPGR